jgi:hypothetical protein
MSLFPSVDLIQITYTPGDYVKGRWQEGEGIPHPFQSSWQPASGKALEVLPEGKRRREAYKAYPPIEMEFTAADEAKGVSGDVVIKDGKEYEVSFAAKWDNGLISHWKIICTCVPPKKVEAEEDDD